MNAPNTQDLEDKLAGVATREDLAELLREVHVRADSPSLRALDDRTKHDDVRLTKSTVADMLAGRRFPRKAMLLAFLNQCGLGGDRAAPWAQTWERIAATQRSRLTGDATELQQLREQVTELAEAEHARTRELTDLRQLLEQRIAEAEQRTDRLQQRVRQLEVDRDEARQRMQQVTEAQTERVPTQQGREEADDLDDLDWTPPPSQFRTNAGGGPA